MDSNQPSAPSAAAAPRTEPKRLSGDVWLGAIRSAGGWLVVAIDGQHQNCTAIAEGAAGSFDTRHLPANRQILGYSIAQASFRRLYLPFKRSRQIKLLLPQEIADHSLYQRAQPAFGFRIAPAADGAHVTYALTEQRDLEQVLGSATRLGLNCGPVVVAELAAWALLAQRQLIGAGPTVIVDTTLTPWAVIKVHGDEVLAVRVVSDASSQVERVALEELNWLAESLVGDGDEVVWVGAATPLLGVSAAKLRRLERSELAIGDWCWLRPLALAEAARQREWTDKLLNFRGSGLARHSPFQQWLKPWLPALGLGAVLLLALSTHYAWDFVQLARQETRLARQLSEQFQTALPGVPMIDPVRQLQQAGPSRGNTGRPSLIAWLGTLQPLLTPESGIRVRTLRYEGADIQLHGEAKNYAELNAFQVALKAKPLVQGLTLEDATKANNATGIQFRLRLH